MSLDLGACLGPYEIASPLGAGGMGEVYKARDRRLDRMVALKVLPPHLAGRPALRKRFAREARAISALNHPHICTLHDVGHQDGIDYLVMEYLEGESLGTRLLRGPLPLDQALRYGVEIADALDRAHRLGIVHRDLKPSNVMLTRWGSKLLDFGVAKLRADGAGDDDLPADPRTLTDDRPLTADGRLIGTVSYMAPEQLKDGSADTRSDIFALGVLLHEMVTGRRAFAGRSLAGVVAAILDSHVPPVSTLQPLAPPALDRAIALCLAKDPDDRWQSAHDLAAHLRGITEEAGGVQPRSATGAPPPARVRTSTRERALWATATLGLAVALLVALLPRDRHPAPPPPAPAASAVGTAAAGPPSPPAPTPAPLPVALAVRPPAGASLVPYDPPALSPSGDRIAFFALVAGRPELYVRGVGGGGFTRVAGTEGGQGAFWSPDGREVGFFAAGAVKAVELGKAAPPRVIAETPGPPGAATWGRQGVVLFESDGRLYQAPAAGGRPRVLDGPREAPRHAPEFLPDGRHFLYHSPGRGPDARPAVFAGSLDGGAPRRLVEDASAAGQSSGRLLFVRENALSWQPFDPTSLAVSGEARSVSRDAPAVAWTGPRRPYAVSPSGVVAWPVAGAVPRAEQLVWFDRSGQRLGTLGDPGDYSAPALSRDQKTLAVGLRDPDARTRDLWLFDLATRAGRRLTTSSIDEAGPAWSPDGTRVAFNSERNKRREIHRMPSAGGAEETLLAAAGSAHVEDWSPDGSLLLYNVWRDDPDLFLLPLAGGPPIPFASTRAREHMGRFAPGGRFIAYVSTETGRDEVWVQALSADGHAGRRWQVSTGGGLEPQWRGDGKELYFVAGSSVMAVDVSASGDTWSAGPPRRLFDVHLSEPHRNRLVATADGRRFLVITTAAAVPERIEVRTGWSSGP